jgi:hypothetical protein
MDHLKVGCTPTYKLEVIIPKEGYFYVELNSFLGRPQGFSSFFYFYNVSLGYNFRNVHYGIKDGARQQSCFFTTPVSFWLLSIFFLGDIHN